MPRNVAREHDLDRILGQRVLQRHDLGDEVAVAVEVGAPVRVGEVEALVHHLRGPRSIEDEGGRVAGRHACRRAPRARRRRGAGDGRGSRPSRFFTSAPPLTMRVSGASMASMTGRAKSKRRPVTSATSMPRPVARRMASRLASGRRHWLSSSVPSMSRAIRRTMGGHRQGSRGQLSTSQVAKWRLAPGKGTTVHLANDQVIPRSLGP